MSDTPETVELRKLYEDVEHRVTIGDIWELCESLERERDEAKAALSGRTMSCSNCNESARTIDAMREAIKEAEKILQSIRLDDIFDDTMRNHAALALAKLQPFLK